MKLSLLKTFLLLIFATLTLSSPIILEEENEVSQKNSIEKRFDIKTYLRSIGHAFNSKDVKRNIFYNGMKSLDVYYSNDENVKKPVVIYIFGGSWYLGEKSLYSKLGEFLRDNGFVAVIPNYIQFPFGNADEMTHDVGEAIKWVYDNVGSYGGDNNNITVLGHSSGAHIAALTLLRSSLLLTDSNGHGFTNFVMHLPQIQRAVLLNGPYDFDVLSKTYQESGVRESNTDTKTLITKLLQSNSNRACPTDILKNYGDGCIKTLGADFIVLMHAEEDATVPFISSTDFLDQIRRTSTNRVALYKTNGYYHCGLTEGVMNGDRNAQNILLDALTNNNLA